jgi:hypothetical protein
MNRLKIIQHIMAIANEVEQIKPEDVEGRIGQLNRSAEEWHKMEMCTPIDEQFEMIYLLTGQQILKALE